MATVKEVKLMDGEEQVTPYTLIDSVWDSDGKKFKENLNTELSKKSDDGHHHDDRYYTEAEINSKFSHKFQTFKLSGSYGNSLQDDDMGISLDVGDSAVILGNITVYNYGFRVRNSTSGSGGKYFISSMEESSTKIVTDLNGYIKEYEGHTAGFTHVLVEYIVRLA